MAEYMSVATGGSPVTADVRGPVTGGVRGSAFGRSGPLMIYGWARPFSGDELRTLYRSRDTYVDAYRRGVDELVAAGGLRRAESSARYDEAEEVAANLDL